MTLLQEKILDIYKKIAQICIENNISFYAIGGTCIGAIRHRGFIPWDDDLDIAIPIEQYEKFKTCMKAYLPSNLYLYDPEEKKEYRYVFCKVCDRDTTFVEESEKQYLQAYKGIFVDVMPISGVPSKAEEKKEFVHKILTYYKFNYIFRFPLKDMESIKQKAVWLFIHILYFYKPFHVFSDRWTEMLKKNPFETAECVGYVWNTKIKRLVFPKAFFSDYTEMPFEDTTIRCPIDYDGYLTQQFGDYMKIPPENQREQHHPYIVDLEHSYQEYIDGRKEIAK